MPDPWMGFLGISCLPLNFSIGGGFGGENQAHFPPSLPVGETGVVDRKDRVSRLSGLSRGKTMS